MWNNRLRANVAKVIYDVWKDQGEPQTLAARDILEHYKQKMGHITPELLDEVLAVMEDDSGPMPFLRVRLPRLGGEMNRLGITDINAERLLTLATGTS